LFAGGVDKERGLDGGVGDGDGGGHGGVDFGDFFEHEDVGEGVESGAAPFFGEQHAAAAEGAELFYGVEGEMVGAFPVFDVGTDFGVHEFADGVADEEVVIGEGEIHLGDGSTGAKRIGHGDTEGTERSENGKWKIGKAKESRTVKKWKSGKVNSKGQPKTQVHKTNLGHPLRHPGKREIPHFADSVRNDGFQFSRNRQSLC